MFANVPPLAALTLGAFGALTAIVLGLVFDALFREASSGPGSLESRIETLSESLTDAAVIISDIESEVEARQDLVERLLEQQKVAEAATRLNQEAVEAIAQILRAEVDAGSRRTLLVSIAVNVVIGLVFFGMGIGASEFFHRRRARYSVPPS